MKKSKLIVCLLVTTMLLAGCNSHNENSNMEPTEEIIATQDLVNMEQETDEEKLYDMPIADEEKLYDMPIADEERERLTEETLSVVEPVKDIIQTNLKLSGSGCLSDEIREKVVDQIGKQGISATLSTTYWNMRNYNQIEEFLSEAEKEQKDESVSIYMVNMDGGILRYYFQTEDNLYYLTSVNVTWNDDGLPVVSSMRKCYLQSIACTEKGWLIIDQCVPEYPDVTDAMNGEEVIRVKPMKQEYAEYNETYFATIGYQGNNMFLTDWNSDDYQDLDFNDLYEYIYYLANGIQVDPVELDNGIPKEDFETLMTKYFDITPEQLEQTASYEKETQTYQWIKLGCGNYAPGLYGTAIPEVVDMEEEKDGTLTFTIDAVWEGYGIDQAFTHKVNVRMDEDGQIHFLSNEIIQSEDNCIPQYTHRTKE